MAKNTKVLKIARLLRQKMTQAEKILWQELRNKKLNGIKFRRQMPLVFGNYHFIVDFYCPSKKLIIEIDGEAHNERGAKEYDAAREDVLKTAGHKIVRFKNEDVLFVIDKVLDKIIQKINTSPDLS